MCLPGIWRRRQKKKKEKKEEKKGKKRERRLSNSVFQKRRLYDDKWQTVYAPFCACGVLRHCEVAACITYAISLSSFFHNAGRCVG